jgi:hypothetical protein
VISDDSVHPRHTEVPQVWPKNTDLYFNASENIKLTHQTSIVRATITKAFGFLHASIVLENSYPDAVLTSKFIQDALSTAALHIPDAEDVHVRVLKDYPYCVKMSILVCCLCSSLKSTDINLAPCMDQYLSLRGQGALCGSHCTLAWCP